MRIAVLDITGRNAVQYNPSLCNALEKIEKDITLLCPTLKCSQRNFKYFRIAEVVPKSWVNRETLLKRGLRAFEVFLNYFIVWLYMLIKKPDALHVQWLPFLEFSAVEKKILWLYQKTCPHTKLFLTIHNVYPHNQTDAQKKDYRDRFTSVDRYFTGYLVHLQRSKEELIRDFCIEPSKIDIAYHGIYKAEGYMQADKTIDEKINIIMYGTQTRYKGVDIFIDAYKLLPDSYRNRIGAKIMGRMDKDLYEKCKTDAESLGVELINRFVSDEELYSAINEADLILLPYRSITQSGVLLLALSYNKPIITSDLPSFKETLDGYNEDEFFKSNDAESLCEMLIRFADGGIDVDRMKSIISKLNIKYSWEETAKATYNAYSRVGLKKDK